MNDIKYHEPYLVIDKEAEAQRCNAVPSRGRAGIFIRVSLTPSQAFSNTVLYFYMKRGISYHPPEGARPQACMHAPMLIDQSGG